VGQFEKLKKLLMRWLPAFGEARAQHIVYAYRDEQTAALFPFELFPRFCRQACYDQVV
jgi:hypothetical protein